VTAQIEHALPAGNMLHHYRILKTLGGGGFSIVYLGLDTVANRQVVIKEYLPLNQAKRAADESVETISSGINTFRHGLKRFFDEAATLAKVNHPNIVRVTDFFRENNTVYLVMTHEKGRDLRWHIKQHHGRLSEKFIRTVFPPLLQGLRELHRHRLLHLDVKPSNILLRPGGLPLLLDFGAAQAAYSDNRPVGPHTLTLGFAPIEQHQRGHVGPWTDLYAVGATIYACMSGRAPPAATKRAEKDGYRPALKAFARHYTRELLEAVDWCLTMDQAKRPQTVDDLLTAFERIPDAPPARSSLLDRLGLLLSWSRR
jgi:serine/threonine protein kinase